MADEIKRIDVLVIRSIVDRLDNYLKYKRIIRKDFLYSCAYCTISESEADARRFSIDHYEPVSIRPELETVYENLMYCCQNCNSLKGDFSPPESARRHGIRYFRPDEHVFDDHFKLDQQKLLPNSPIGEFTIDALHLNRSELQRLRLIRARLAECDEFIAAGIRALSSFPLDQLPPAIRSKAIDAINNVGRMEKDLVDELDTLLKYYAASQLDGPDGLEENEVEEVQRKEKLRKLQSLHPGTWRGRGKRK